MYKQLTREQRYAIYLGKQEGRSQTAIARQIGVNKSTVSRELKRNSNRHGKYGWAAADERAKDSRGHMPGNRALPDSVVRESLRLLRDEDWSPRQISGYLDKKGVKISHESIYSRILSDGSGELRSHCRHKLKYRHHKKVARKTKATNIPNRVSIHDRPAEADGRRFGDWEMNLIIGKNGKGAIITLCERSRNYLLMVRLPYGKNPHKVAEAAVELLYPYRRNVLTITTDNGSEFSRHELITKRLNAPVFFADSKACFPKEYKMILSIAYYLILEDSSPVSLRQVARASHSSLWKRHPLPAQQRTLRVNNGGLQDPLLPDSGPQALGERISGV